MIRVAHLFPDLADGGGQRLALAWVPALRSSGFDIELGYLQPNDELASAFQAVDCPTTLLPHVPGHGLRTIDRIRRFLRDRDIDLVHTHATIDKVFGHPAAVLARVPVVCHIHAMPPEAAVDAQVSASTSPRDLRSAAIHVVRHSWDRMAVNRYIAVSDAVAQAFRSRLPAQVDTIHNGIDVEKFQPAEIFPSTRRTVLHVGRLAAAKRQDLLITAFALVAHNHDDVDLVIVGDGPLRSDLERHARDLGVGDRVRFLGRLADIRGAMVSSTVFAFPSRNEGFGLAVAEAMACGVPVVAARLPALEEIIQDGDSGILVRPDDADALAAGIVRYLDDPAFAREIAERGRLRILENFTLDRQIEQIAAVYRSVLTRR